ncbi:hypothetical protein [Pseudactinotalea terrae]|uniref:hypothetical protein n=1 Tax=Pseudactinotalea terrae TaxID=1743262 RepID=UPI0012E0D569|nr:hypothetical protein [Pseudactinotalea terrae]
MASPREDTRPAEVTGTRAGRDHLTGAEDDYDIAVRNNLRRGPETARLRALLSLAHSTLRNAGAAEVANDLAALNTPGLLDEAQAAAVRDRVRGALEL